MSHAAFLRKAQATPGGPRPSTVRALVLRAAFCLLLVGGIRDLPRHTPCEQGDALAPALFLLGQHDGHERAAAELQAGTALGVPLGHPDYVREWGRRRVQDEQAFMDHLPHLPDLQCAWFLLLLCSSTRANHALRNIPPDMVQPYAEARDRAICATLRACLGEELGPVTGHSVAYSYQLLPRTRAAADLGTSPPGPAAFPVRPTSGCLAYSNACGQGHRAPT